MQKHDTADIPKNVYDIRTINHYRFLKQQSIRILLLPASYDIEGRAR